MVAEGVRMEADEKCQKAVELFLPGSRGLEGVTDGGSEVESLILRMFQES